MTTIARDAGDLGDLIAWWDAEELDDEVEVICGPSETVVFVSDGEPLFELGTGQHALSADSHQTLEDWLDGDDDSIEVAFLTTVPVAVDVVTSIVRSEADEAEVSGRGLVRVTDASAAIALLEKLSDDESLEEWVGDEIAVHLAGAVDAQESGSLLDITSGAYDGTLVEEALTRANEALGSYGLEVQALGPLRYALEEETEGRLMAAAEAKARAARAAGRPGTLWRCSEGHTVSEKGGVCPRCRARLVPDA